MAAAAIVIAAFMIRDALLLVRGELRKLNRTIERNKWK